jgi:hypothetical protein
MYSTRQIAAMFAVSAALAMGGATLARAEDVSTTRTVDRPAGDVSTTRTVDRPAGDVSTTRTVDRPAGDVTTTRNLDRPVEGRAAADCATHSMTRTNDATDTTVDRTKTNCR